MECGSYNFPRTKLLAAFTATNEAAKRIHDERIGKRACQHIFRLGTKDEMEIHRLASSPELNLLDSALLQKNAAMDFLAKLGGETIEIPAGPIQIGEIADATSPDGIAEAAKHYLAAFKASADFRSFPYYTDTRR